MTAVAGALTMALALSTTVLAAPAAAVEAQGVRVDVAEPDLVGGSSFLRPAIPPGGAATYALQVRNQHEQAVEVLVYGADLIGPQEIGSGLDNEEVGAWITADRPRLEIPAQAAEQVLVTIERPAGDEDGGQGAIVAQLTDAARQELSLERIQRAALRVEVAADGSGDGVHVAVEDTDVAGGLLPGVLDVTVVFSHPSVDERQEVSFDGSVVLSRPFVEDPAVDVDASTLPADTQDVLASAEIDLPWYGLVGNVWAEAAVSGLTTRSAPVRVVALPPWLALLLVAMAAVAVWRAHRSDTPIELGRVPGSERDYKRKNDGGS